MRAVIAARPANAWPDVDVVMPVRNEADHLRAAVEAVTAQAYEGALRIYLVVGPSEDGTEEIAASIALERADVVVVENPAGITPVALNLGIDAGSAPVIVRVDGHSQLSDGYIRRAIETMRRTGAVNVGGRQVPVPTTPFEEAVAAATTSWLGTGGATYRVGGHEGPVDTVYLGVFDRAAVEAVGGFDERLIRNQDYELNIRLRTAGGTVWFDPELSVGYRPRGTWDALAKQYFEYGRYKRIVMYLHPRSARLRQVIPPLAICAVAAGIILAPRHRRALVLPAAYVVAVGRGMLVPGSHERSRSWRQRLLDVAVLPLLHLSWAAGFLVPHCSGCARRTGSTRRPAR